MSRVFLGEVLNTVATFWSILRKDGVTLGFTSHDRALWFGGIRYRAAPGMVPNAIRRSAGLSPDSAEVRGVLAHGSIRTDDLRAGRFDDAAIAIGAVDWKTHEHTVLYHGRLGTITEENRAFTADLHSAKTALNADHIPRTSPTCRAQFCGPGCHLSSAMFTREASVVAVNPDANSVQFADLQKADFVHGECRWLDGPTAGTRSTIIGVENEALVLDTPVPPGLAFGSRAVVREGCDHVFTTCRTRFDNAVNFQGEPFLPGNDLLARYPQPE
ncbi:MAG: DUF2163 domain-containing protein [Pontixanthobacter sp.]